LYNLHSRTTLRKNKKDIYIVIDRKSRIIMKDGYRILEVVKKIRHFKKLVRSRIDESDLEAFHRVTFKINEIIEEGDVFKN